MSAVLLACRYLRDASGQLFDLATGCDVQLQLGRGESQPTEAILFRENGAIDVGLLDDGKEFVAVVEERDRRPSVDAANHASLGRLAADLLDAAQGDALRELVVRPPSAPERWWARLSIAREARRAGFVPVSFAGLRRLQHPSVLAGMSVALIEASGDTDAHHGQEMAASLLVLTAIGARPGLVAEVSTADAAAQVPLWTGSTRVAERERLGWELVRDGAAWQRRPRPAQAPRGVGPSVDQDEHVVETARHDHRLQAVRGARRRRGDAAGYLQSSLALARLRFGNMQMASAARIAREARGWRGWWGACERVDGRSLELALALHELESSALAQGRLSSAIALHAAAGARAAAAIHSGEWTAGFQVTLATVLRRQGLARRAEAVLGERWPDELSSTRQLQWVAEALRVSILLEEWRRAGSLAVRLRELAAGGTAREAALAAIELVAFYLALGDVGAAAVVASGMRFDSLSRIERARARGICRAASVAGGDSGRSISPRRSCQPALCNLTPAVREELRWLGERVTAARSGATGSCRPSTAGGYFAYTRPAETIMQDVLELLRVCHDSDEDRPALDRMCLLLRDRLGAAAVGVWGEGAGEPLAGAGPTRVWPAALADRSQVTGLPHGPERSQDGIEAARPVLRGGLPIGAVACRWLSEEDVDRSRAEVLLAAAAAACAPLVQGMIEKSRSLATADAFGLVGESTVMRDLRAGIQRAGGAPFHVLIEGESGSGKELVARAIHAASARRQRRFCAVNCAALTDELLEAELFGHTRGAFTGALAERAGLFEEASNGTLFLDEIAELSPRGQAKVLRALQDGEIRRLGENFSRRVDVRVVAATNRPLRDEVAQGRFREDLRYRLDVLRLVIPPLRERRDDIGLLATHFWREASARVGTKARLDPTVLEVLARYDWPGNVRELQNVIAALAVQAPLRGRAGVGALPDVVRGARPVETATLDEARRRFEADYVRLALLRTGGRRVEAARMLGVTRQGLAKLVARLGLDEPR